MTQLPCASQFPFPIVTICGINNVFGVLQGIFFGVAFVIQWMGVPDSVTGLGVYNVYLDTVYQIVNAKVPLLTVIVCNMTKEILRFV